MRHWHRTRVHAPHKTKPTFTYEFVSDFKFPPGSRLGLKNLNPALSLGSRGIAGQRPPPPSSLRLSEPILVFVQPCEIRLQVAAAKHLNCWLQLQPCSRWLSACRKLKAGEALPATLKVQKQPNFCNNIQGVQNNKSPTRP